MKGAAFVQGLLSAVLTRTRKIKAKVAMLRQEEHEDFFMRVLSSDTATI